MSDDAPSDGSSGGQLTIAAAAQQLVAELAPDELVLVPQLMADFFGRPAVRRAVVRRVLHPPRLDVPAASSPEATQLILQTVLVVLNGIATQIIAQQVTSRSGWPRGWWRRRRQRRALRTRVARHAEQTPLPLLTAVDAARIGTEVTEIARGAGFTPEQAQWLATSLAARLQRPAG